jgi:hypothetical protein
VQYGGPPLPSLSATEDEDNIVAALKQSERVSSISLVATSSLLDKLSTINKPFSELEELVLLSQDSVLMTLPSTFRWGLRLRTLHLTRTAIPTPPELLFLSKGLVDLQLHEIPEPGYPSLDVFVHSLSVMTQLRSLSLSHHFFSFAHALNDVHLPHSQENVLFSLLSRTSNIEEIASTWIILWIESMRPRLGDIKITFSQTSMDASHLSPIRQPHRNAEATSSGKYPILRACHLHLLYST